MCGMTNTTGSGEGKPMATPQWEQYGGNWPTDKELTESSLRCMVTEVRNELSAAIRREDVLREALEDARAIATDKLCDLKDGCPQPELCVGCLVAGIVDAALSACDEGRK